LEGVEIVEETLEEVGHWWNAFEEYRLAQVPFCHSCLLSSYHEMNSFPPSCPSSMIFMPCINMAYRASLPWTETFETMNHYKTFLRDKLFLLGICHCNERSKILIKIFLNPNKK
jgi:hypothetical protein